MAHELGGDVMPRRSASTGRPSSRITADDRLLAGLDREQPVWMSHGDSITRLPAGFSATAQTDSTPYAGLADPARNLYGIQFHPEVVHTPRGRDVLRNFVLGIAGRTPAWTPANFIEATVAGIRERVDAHAAATGSDGRVICALSGGVDSAVAAALVHRAVGDRLTCIYVDHGLMRKRESELLRDDLRARTWACTSSWSTRASASSPGSPASRTRRRSAGSSATSSSASSRRRPRSSAASTS